MPYFRLFTSCLLYTSRKEVVSVADNFGLKIGVEGEKEFKKALAEINQTFKVLGSEMNLVASQFDKQDKSCLLYTSRTETTCRAAVPAA